MADCTLLIRGVRVIDGSGKNSYQADVALQEDKIARIGDLGSIEARHVIDGGGFALAPGFIDVHTHDDCAVLATPQMTPKVSQGVTSVVVGNCGVSLSPAAFTGSPPPPVNPIGTSEDYCFPAFADYAAAITVKPPAVNVAALIGHSTLRALVMNSLDRPATEDEIRSMGDHLEASLANGAIGLSSGWDYPAAASAPTDEVIELCRRVGR